MNLNMGLNDNKAGMRGLNKERINAVIRKNTGVNYKKHQEKREERIRHQIEDNRCLLRTFNDNQITSAQNRMDEIVAEIEQERDLSQTIVHLDMDAFYASVEMRDDPRLRNIPMAVGCDSMLSTSNYLARKFGVRAAMPGFIARKLCPNLTIVPGDSNKYRLVSRLIQAVLVDYDPDFCMAGLDEAYLNISDYIRTRTDSTVRERCRYTGDCRCRLPRIDSTILSTNFKKSTCSRCGSTEILVMDSLNFGTNVEEIVAEIRFRIEQLTGLTASAGIAPNGMLAKICSDMHKPNGQYYLPSNLAAISNFMAELPIRKVCGIGGVTESLLEALNIEKCSQLFKNRGKLSLLFSDISIRSFLRISLGIGLRFVSNNHDHERKSISVERTFKNTEDRDELFGICERLCRKLADDTLEKQLSGRTVTLKLKATSFDVRTRAVSCPRSVSSFEDLHANTRQLLGRELDQTPRLELRLMGVRLSNLDSKRAIDTDGDENIARFFHTRVS